MLDTVSMNETALLMFGPDPYPSDEPDSFWESGCMSMLKQEAEYRESGNVFAWIDEKPDWVSITDWGTRQILPDPKNPRKRRVWLSLIGGGQVRILENFVRDEKLDFLWCRQPKLKVQTTMGDGLLHTYHGIIDGSFAEMGAAAAIFHRGTPLEIADRTAATFRLITEAEHFTALLAKGERCSFCRRPLRDEVSKQIGIGPDCAAHSGLPHNHEVANRAMKLRQELLGE